MPVPAQPLFAVDWVEIAIIVFIMTSSLVGQLFKAAQKRQQKAQRKPRRPPAQVPPAPAQRRPEEVRVGPAQKPKKDSLEKEIEAFLRQTFGGPEAQGNKPPARREAEDRARSASATQQTRRPAQAKQRPRQRPPQPPRPRQLKQKPPAFPPQESVGEHVQRHIRQGGVAARDAHLGDTIGQSDERLESHLSEVFEHRLGSLSGDQRLHRSTIHEGTDAAVWTAQRAMSPMNQQLFEMLSSTQHLQAALVLSEILRRPEERWE